MIICLDAGHGGFDSGAIGYKIKEKDISLKLVLAIGQGLTDYEGVYIIYTRTDDSFITLQKRCDIANNANANLFLSMHCNASLNKKGTGFESYCLYNAYHSTVKIRETIHNQVARLLEKYGITDRGQKYAGFWVLKHTEMPAILFENGFIDYKTDNAFLANDDNIKKLAAVYCESIANIFKLKKKYNFYIVQKGDTLWGITRKLHPNFNNQEVAGYVNKIIAANKLNSEFLQIGQKIFLP